MRSVPGDTAVAAGETAILLCTLWLSDRVVRVATRPVLVVDGETGQTYSYEAGLLEVVEFAEEVDYFELSGAGSLQQASVKLVLPESVGAAALDDTWRWLVAGRAELALVWEDQAWQARRILVPATRLSLPKLELANGIMEFQLETAALSDGALLGDPDRDLGEQHPTLGFTRLDGQQYPVILGKCYRIPGLKLGIWPADRTLALCGHTLGSDVVVGDFAFYLEGETYSPVGTVTLVQSTDDSGKISYLNSNSGSDFTSSQADFTVDCNRGGLAGPNGTSAKTVEDLLHVLLTQSGEVIDWHRSRPALDFFADWELGLYVDSATPTLTLLKERLLPWLPAFLQQGPDGIKLVHAAPWLQTPAFALVDEQNCSLASLVSITDWTKVKNSFTLSYYWDGSLGEYTRRLTLSANHPLGRLSQQLFGLQAESELSCNVCWADGTAAKILEARMQRQALPRRQLSGVLASQLYYLEAGQVGTVESARLGLSARRCYIRSIQPFASPPEVLLELLPDTALDAGEL